MLEIKYYNQFKKDYKKAIKRGLDKKLLKNIVLKLQNRESLPAKNRDHQLINYCGKDAVRECHIQPDWLLIYELQEDKLILGLLRTGTHSDLFK